MSLLCWIKWTEQEETAPCGGNKTEHQTEQAHSCDVDTENGKASEQRKHDAGKSEMCIEFKQHKAKFDMARVEYHKTSRVDFCSWYAMGHPFAETKNKGACVHKSPGYI